MEEGLVIKIGADVAPAVKEFNKVATALEQMSATAEGSTASVAKSVSQIDVAASHAAQGGGIDAMAAGFDAVGKAASRVAGSIAQVDKSVSFSNAINSFNELKKEALGVGNALEKIPASVSGFNTQGIDAYRNAVKGLKTDADRLRNINIASNLNATNKAAKGAAESIARIKPAGSQANQALTDLTRIASDAPFGFIAIQNNLGPLFESFGRLKKESGGLGGALKGLGASLMGPAGIFFAFTAITSAITYFVQSSNRAKKATEELKEELRSVSEIRADSEASVTGEIAKVRALTAAVLDETKSKKERGNAINQLKAINKEYFGQLSLETSQLATLTDKTNEYTKALINNAVTQGFTDEIKETNKALRKQTEELNKLRDAKVAADNAASKEDQSLVFTGGGVAVGPAALLANAAAEKANDAFIKQRAVVEKLESSYVALEGAMKGAVDAQLKMAPLTTPSDGKEEKVVDALKKKIETLKELRSEVGLLRAEEQKLLDLEIQLAVRDQKVNGLTNAQLDRVIGNLIRSSDSSDRTVVLPIKVIPKIDVAAAVGGIPTEIIPPKVNDQIVDTQKKTEALANTVSQQLTPAFMGAFESIANGSQTALGAFMDIIKAVLKQLAAAVIQAAIFAAIMSVASGGAGAAGGVSFGAAFGQQFGGLTGIKLPGGAANLGRGAQGGAFMAAPDRLVAEVSGQKLLLVMSRSQNSNNRLG